MRNTPLMIHENKNSSHQRSHISGTAMRFVFVARYRFHDKYYYELFTNVVKLTDSKY